MQMYAVFQTMSSGHPLTFYLPAYPPLLTALIYVLRDTVGHLLLPIPG